MAPVADLIRVGGPQGKLVIGTISRGLRPLLFVVITDLTLGTPSMHTMVDLHLATESTLFFMVCLSMAVYFHRARADGAGARVARSWCVSAIVLFKYIYIGCK